MITSGVMIISKDKDRINDEFLPDLKLTTGRGWTELRDTD